MLALEDIPETPPRHQPSAYDERSMQNTIRQLKESNAALKANREARGGGSGNTGGSWARAEQEGPIGGGGKGTAGKGGKGGQGGGKKRPPGNPVTLATDQSGTHPPLCRVEPRRV